MSLVPGEPLTSLATLLEADVPSWEEGSFRDAVSFCENFWLQQTDVVFKKKIKICWQSPQMGNYGFLRRTAMIYVGCHCNFVKVQTACLRVDRF